MTGRALPFKMPPARRYRRSQGFGLKEGAWALPSSHAARERRTFAPASSASSADKSLPCSFSDFAAARTADDEQGVADDRRTRWRRSGLRNFFGIDQGGLPIKRSVQLRKQYYFDRLSRETALTIYPDNSRERTSGHRQQGPFCGLPRVAQDGKYRM